MPQNKISMVVNAGSGSAEGQKVAFSHAYVGAMTIQNTSSSSIQYSTDGGTGWTTVAAGASATPTVPDPSKFRLRKTVSDGAPAQVALTFVGVNDATAAGYTVATLPAAGEPGRRSYVTDATSPTYLGTLTGGGSVRCPVFDNGTAWVSA